MASSGWRDTGNGSRRRYLFFRSIDGKRALRPAPERMQKDDKKTDEEAAIEAKLLQVAAMHFDRGTALSHHMDILRRYRVISRTDRQPAQEIVDVPRTARTITIRQAAADHPSSVREKSKHLGEWNRHINAVDKFCEFAGVKLLYQLKLSDVTRWLNQMKKDGVPYDTRRHNMMYLRRASMMGPQYDLPHMLAGFKLDKREDAPKIDFLSIEELTELIRALQTDKQRLALVGIMAFCGLRTTEVCRLRVKYFESGLLHVGAEERKNSASFRVLPIPPTLAKWISEATEGREPNQMMFMGADRDGNPYNNFPRWMRLGWPESVRHIPAKCLRKTFATHAGDVWGLDPAHVERYLGHRITGYSDVTARHYKAKADAERLRPACDLLENAIGVITGVVTEKKRQQKRR